MDALTEKLKNEIIGQLNLTEINGEEITPDTALFGNGLGLDSIDALELMVLLEKNYGIKVTDPKKAKAIFVSIRTMADFIKENKKELDV